MLAPLRLRKPKVIWGEYLGRPECPFARRWVLDLGFVAFRLHQWFKLGQQEAMHDHAWPFLTVVLSGGYMDVSETREGETLRDVLRRGSVRYRPAHHRHYVHVDEGGGWSLVVSGREQRQVRFWHHGVPWRPADWYEAHGPQPCD